MDDTDLHTNQDVKNTIIHSSNIHRIDYVYQSNRVTITTLHYHNTMIVNRCCRSSKNNEYVHQIVSVDDAIPEMTIAYGIDNDNVGVIIVFTKTNKLIRIQLSENVSPVVDIKILPSTKLYLSAELIFSKKLEPIGVAITTGTDEIVTVYFKEFIDKEKTDDI